MWKIGKFLKIHSRKITLKKYKEGRSDVSKTTE